MSKAKPPVTAAVRFLRQHQVEFSDHLYAWEEHGGTAVSARELQVDEHQVVKTLIMEDEHAAPLIVLMHGDREVSTRQLARLLGRRAIQPCAPATAQKHSGYLVGGTSPFGTVKPMPVCVEDSIFTLPRIYINGGKRGYLVGIDPAELEHLLPVQRVHVAV